ncbi:nucleotide exchange factor GrpE [Fervidobacterium sp.]
MSNFSDLSNEMNEKKEEKIQNEAENVENKVKNNSLDEIDNLTEENKQLKEKITELEAQLKEIQNAARVIKAAFENYKLDVEKQIKDSTRSTALRIMRAMIPVIDDFKRAFKHFEVDRDLEKFKFGIEKIYEKFVKILENEGLKQIDASGRFDPFNHEALEREERDDVEEYTITEVLEDGYTFNGQVIKPSKVRVAVKPRKKASDESIEQNLENQTEDNGENIRGEA